MHGTVAARTVIENTEEHRIPVLDGVRGIAVLLILMVHFTPDVVMPWRFEEWIKKAFITGGWVGVDLFFVLSGFLITRILLKAKGSPHYFVNFYMRRVLRIFPLYYAALIIVFVLLPALGVVAGESFEPIRTTQAYHWFYLTNVGWWLLGPDAFASNQIELRHLWSLAVEEHFYLIWPAVIFASSLRTVRQICVALLVSALLIRCIAVVTIGPESMFFYLTPCRWDALAAGALIATLLQEHGVAPLKRYTLHAGVVLAAGAAFLAIFFFTMKGLWAGHWLMRTAGLSTLAITFSAAIFILIQKQDGAINHVVGSSILRFFGKYSYGLYVIHALMIPPLLFWLPTETWMSRFPGSPMLGSFSLSALKIGICLSLAIASWHLYEKQFLKLKRFFRYARLAPPVGYEHFCSTTDRSCRII